MIANKSRNSRIVVAGEKINLTANVKGQKDREQNAPKNLESGFSLHKSILPRQVPD
jgi:hypothetical protein